MRLLIISGRSGSGKSITLQVLEDLGYYCVDNLPIEMVPDLSMKLKSEQLKLAISIDARNLPTRVEILEDVLQKLKAICGSFETIYLDAHQEVLLKRFSETRRKHPLSNSKLSLTEAILYERQVLSTIANIANITIDTSQLSKHELCNMIRERVTHENANNLQLLIQSFAFKNGTPVDADFMFDVRCLPNPYWQPNLRMQTGLDEGVIHFLETHADVHLMVEDILRFLDNWIPRFEADNRSYLTVGIGCTGGQHRSVYIAEQIAKREKRLHLNIQIRHRDL
ncbi:RNase adapter RapZ [Candidatus Berkiella cookevillensis]|uniref:GlmZ(SRNA)-inactivating NTPase n=1 Tax=Candidatus Berkiella cookevillensis TaxID=437022 RepID=A0A0Q9YMN7_9GAMM|nr:RNase adapter RapZ [Candidatus Berkiella cookevillensis]MCS5709241.1 RNase adapter RapZ [Candidatus Berkiella cookevillensis]